MAARWLASALAEIDWWLSILPIEVIITWEARPEDWQVTNDYY